MRQTREKVHYEYKTVKWLIVRKGKREVLEEHYRKLGTPTTNKTFDAKFEKEINAWAEANVDDQKGKTVVQKGCRGFTREEVKKCLAKLCLLYTSPSPRD